MLPSEYELEGPETGRKSKATIVGPENGLGPLPEKKSRVESNLRWWIGKHRYRGHDRRSLVLEDLSTCTMVRKQDHDAELEASTGWSLL